MTDIDITLPAEMDRRGTAAALPEYADHEIAAIFPLIRDDELARLVADVEAHGVREPIWLFERKILDGRNRYRAAKAAGKGTQFRQFEGTKLAAIEFVWSMNRTRRHLTPSQAAIADAERNKLLNAYAGVRETAKERQRQSPGRPQKDVEQIPHLFKCHCGEQFNKQVWHCERCDHHWPMSRTECWNCHAERNKTRSIRAKIAGTNPKYIDLADRLVTERPDLAEAVKQGEKTLTQVQRELKREQVADQVKALPTGKFRVIYADPPWAYNDLREGLGASDGQKIDRATTAADHHYPPMTMAEIAALDVRSLAADDAVLFMWATFPMLPEQLEIPKAWGFKYKTAFIWDKGRGSFGHYHKAEAEALLVCTRGSCVPEVDKRENQIQRFPRSEHSRKPEEFRHLIDRLYPHGPRIELFRRGAAPVGWVVWGNEAKESEAA